MRQQVSLSRVYKLAWSMFADRWLFLMAFFTAALLLSLAPYMVLGFLHKSAFFLQILMYLLTVCFGALASLGLTRVTLDIARGGRGSFMDLIEPWGQVLDLILSKTVIVCACIFIFFLCGLASDILTPRVAQMLVDSGYSSLAGIDITEETVWMFSRLFGFLTAFPVVVWMIVRLFFTINFIVDDLDGPITAIKASWRLTRGMGWKLFVLALSSASFLLASLLFIGVGALIALPVIYLVYALVYIELSMALH